MRFIPQSLKLKDGRFALIRQAEMSDAEKISHFLIERAMETEYMLRDPDECETPPEMRKIIHQTNQSETDLMIVCEVENEIVGNAELNRRKHRKTFHRAEVSVGTLKLFWGLGIGTALMQAIIQAAREYGITQLELNVFQGNDRAIGMYQKLGFETVAVRPNCIRRKDGTRLAAITMFKTLDESE